MADVSKVNVGNVDYNLKDATARTHIADTTIHVTSSDKTNWNTAYSNSHTHSNKTALDTITSTKISNWDSAVQPSALDAYTLKSGDTMTGALTINTSTAQLNLKAGTSSTATIQYNDTLKCIEFVFS